MKLNHTGHEVYKCARVAGHTKKFVFNGLIFEFVCYINVLCCIAYSNVCFQCKTCECLVSFKFLSMSCVGSFQ